MTKKKQIKRELVGLIPMGDQEKMAAFWSDSFKALFTDGKVSGTTTSEGYTPSAEEIEKYQTNLNIAIKKLDEYKEELIRCQAFLTTIDPAPDRTTNLSM